MELVDAEDIETLKGGSLLWLGLVAYRGIVPGAAARFQL